MLRTAGQEQQRRDKSPLPGQGKPQPELEINQWGSVRLANDLQRFRPEAALQEMLRYPVNMSVHSGGKCCRTFEQTRISLCLLLQMQQHTQAPSSVKVKSKNSSVKSLVPALFIRAGSLEPATCCPGLLHFDKKPCFQGWIEFLLNGCLGDARATSAPEAKGDAHSSGENPLKSDPSLLPLLPVRQNKLNLSSFSGLLEL